MKNIKGWPVMKYRCKTCPFRPDLPHGIFSHGKIHLQNSVQSRILKQGSQQICHHAILEGKPETHLCRGARDWFLKIAYNLGWITEPTDIAFEKEIAKHNDLERIPAEYLSLLKEKFSLTEENESQAYREVFGGTRYLRSGDKKEIDTTSFTDEWLDYIVELASREGENMSSRRGYAASILRTVKAHKVFKGDPIASIPKTIADLQGALREYIGTGENKWLFKEQSDGFWLPYFVTGIVYHPPQRSQNWTIPAYVTLAMQSKDATESVTWYKENLRGRPNAAEILDQKGLRLETEEAVEAYLESFERYKTVSEQTGKQFLAQGFGTISTKQKSYWNNEYTVAESLSLTLDGVPSKVVMDDSFVTQNPDKEKSAKSTNDQRRYSWWDEESNNKKDPEGMVDASFWGAKAPIKSKANGTTVIIHSKESEEYDEDDEDSTIEFETEFDHTVFINSGKVPLPYWPYVTVFDLNKHMHVKSHISNLEDYPYNTDLLDKLVLPEEHKDLLTILVGGAGKQLEDIVSGKSGGIIIIATGPPGCGKTLTAEVYCEVIEKALYTVQCSQLGLTPEALEANLREMLQKAQRWGAILLLDECDVYCRERENDIQQNAIVGVFLRVLETYRGVMFLTSNRATVLDDAILSRCTAHIRYDYPNTLNLKRIWRVLSTAILGTALPKELITQLVTRFPKLSGRSVKQLLKLSAFYAANAEEGTEVDFGMIEMIAQFQNIEGRDAT